MIYAARPGSEHRGRTGWSCSDLGYVAFYAVGAYGSGPGRAVSRFGLLSALPLAAMLAALFGGVPASRCCGCMATIWPSSPWALARSSAWCLNNWLEFTGGPNGVSAPPPQLFGLEFTRTARDGGIPFHEYFQISLRSTTPLHLHPLGTVPDRLPDGGGGHPPAQYAGGSGLGSVARGRDRLPRPGYQPRPGQTSAFMMGATVVASPAYSSPRTRVSSIPCRSTF